MLSSLLKDHTKLPHQLLEKKLAERIKKISSEQDYVELLSLFYGFVSPLERMITALPVDKLLPDYPERRKSASIAADLIFLGTDPADLDLCRNLPDIRHTFEAFGALYVLEGSTLGGQIISKMIRDRVNGISDRALSFFNSYGSNTMSMWEKFKTTIDKVRKENQPVVVDYASATFLNFKNWIETHE